MNLGEVPVLHLLVGSLQLVGDSPAPGPFGVPDLLQIHVYQAAFGGKTCPVALVDGFRPGEPEGLDQQLDLLFGHAPMKRDALQLKSTQGIKKRIGNEPKVAGIDLLAIHQQGPFRVTEGQPFVLAQRLGDGTRRLENRAGNGLAFRGIEPDVADCGLQRADNPGNLRKTGWIERDVLGMDLKLLT